MVHTGLWVWFFWNSSGASLPLMNLPARGSRMVRRSSSMRRAWSSRAETLIPKRPALTAGNRSDNRTGTGTGTGTCTGTCTGKVGAIVWSELRFTEGSSLHISGGLASLFRADFVSAYLLSDPQNSLSSRGGRRGLGRAPRRPSPLPDPLPTPASRGEGETRLAALNTFPISTARFRSF